MTIKTKTNYEERLRISLKGSPVNLFTQSGLLVATGYDRVVIGGHGPFVEFTKSQLVLTSFKLVEEWRLTHPYVYYHEYRSIDKYYVKLYYQTKLVDYADYKVDYWYIRPYDLFLGGGLVVIDRLKDLDETKALIEQRPTLFGRNNPTQEE